MFISLGISFVIAIFIGYLGYRQFKWSNQDVLRYTLFGSIVTIVLSIGFYYICESASTTYREVWNYKSQQVVYYEKWTERVTSTDSKGKTHTSYVHHSAYYRAITEFGTEDPIDRSVWQEWSDRWGNSTKHDCFHFGQSSRGDGDKWIATWDGNFETMLPLSRIHFYENKIRAGDSVWSYAQVSEENAKRFTRPADNNNTSPIISYGPSPQTGDELFLRRINAEMGPTYQIHNMVCLLNSKEFPDAGIVKTILDAWKGPNKNELVCFVGLDGDKVKWCDVSSWMDDTTIHSIIRQEVSENLWSVKKYGEILRKNVPKLWHRKEFKDFSYISVSLSLWQYILVIVITTGGLIATMFFVENYR